MQLHIKENQQTALTYKKYLHSLDRNVAKLNSGLVKAIIMLSCETHILHMEQILYPVHTTDYQLCIHKVLPLCSLT